MSWSFKPGDRVVCVDGTPRAKMNVGMSYPQEDKIYTVREVVAEYGKLAIRLVEIRNPPKRYVEAFAECAWTACRFRPVRTTSIDCLRAHLVTKRDEVDA